MTNLRLKWALLFLAIIIAGFYLWPTVRYYAMDPAKRDSNDPAVADVRAKAMQLGLDLKGGSYLVYEVNLDKIAPDQIRGDEVDRAIEIIRNRVDQFGVAEPVIQKQGDRRIVVQLPGLQDPQRAKELIGKTARLDFRMVKSQDEFLQALTIIDAAAVRMNLVSGEKVPDPFQDALLANADSTGADSTGAADSSLAVVPPVPGSDERPFSSLFVQVPGADGGYAFCPAANLDKAQEIWENLAANENKEPKVLAGNTMLVWGNEFGNDTTNPGRYIYALTGRADLTGDQVEDATVAFGMDSTNPTGAGVSLVLNKRGAGVFTKLTGNNVGRQLAIVLDNQVKSAPVIRDKIRGGKASITGLSGDSEARDLAIVLRAGALPTDLTAQEERTVGPSLGKDSIEQGILSAVVGAGLVVLLILIWYRASGVLAVIALMLNLFFLFAALGMLRGTLTLPGIAGIVLTIGIAVDANVLIFERIREELRIGKTVRGAIDAGFGRALVTILDANVTTLISSIVLFQFGTGPIKGFALTLMIGVTANVFTAVYVTRLIYDSFLQGRQVQKLSI